MDSNPVDAALVNAAMASFTGTANILVAADSEKVLDLFKGLVRAFDAGTSTANSMLSVQCNLLRLRIFCLLRLSISRMLPMPHHLLAVLGSVILSEWLSRLPSFQ